MLVGALEQRLFARWCLSLTPSLQRWRNFQLQLTSQRTHILKLRRFWMPCWHTNFSPICISGTPFSARSTLFKYDFSHHPSTSLKHMKSSQTFSSGSMEKSRHRNGGHQFKPRTLRSLGNRKNWETVVAKDKNDWWASLWWASHTRTRCEKETFGNSWYP